MPYDDAPPSGHVYVLVTHAMHDDHQTQFEFEGIRMVMERGSAELPFNLRLGETMVEGFGNTWPDILDETTFIRVLLKVSPQWIFSLAAAQTISLSRYSVTQLREIPFEEAMEREENRLEVAAALRAYKVAIGAVSKARRATKKRTRRTAKGSRDKISSSSASGFVSEAEEWWEDVVKGGKSKRARRDSSAKDGGEVVSGEVGGSGGVGAADKNRSRGEASSGTGASPSGSRQCLGDRGQREDH